VSTGIVWGKTGLHLLRVFNHCVLSAFKLPVLLAACACLSVTPAAAATLQAQMLDAAGKPLANAVVTLRGAAGAAHSVSTDVMDQVDRQFVPNVLVVRTGEAVKFPNSDNIRHHVYSFSPAKRFELRLYQGTPSEPVVFDTPGVVVLGCNIHDWMVGYVYITDDPWFAVSDAQGQLSLENLPEGRYEATLWHPQNAKMLPVAGGELELGAKGLSQTFNFDVAASAAVAPEAPVSSFGDAFNKAKRNAAQ